MDDIRDITSSSNSEQTSGSSQQTTPNQYSPYGQQGQYGGQYGQYGQTPAPQEDKFPEFPTKQKKKISLPALIVVGIFLIVFIIGMITLAPVYKAGREYGKALVKGDSVDKISEMVFPEKLIKNGDEVIYESFSGVIEEKLNEIDDLGDAKFTGVKLGKKIKSGDLKDIAKYYEVICKLADCNISLSIEKGYESEVRFKAGGKKYYQKCCIIKMRGEGWKIFPGSLDELQSVMIMLNTVDSMDF